MKEAEAAGALGLARAVWEAADGGKRQGAEEEPDCRPSGGTKLKYICLNGLE